MSARKYSIDGKALLVASSENAARNLLYVYTMVRKSMLVAVLAGISTYLSFRYSVLINLNGNDIVTVAVVYPLVFSLNAAYQRRQEALKNLASLKGHAFALRLCVLHWGKETRSQLDMSSAVDGILQKFFLDLKEYLSAEVLIPSKEDDIIRAFVALSLLHEKLRADGLPSPEIARASGYLRSMLVDFENMKNAHVYRTPSILLNYTKFFLAVIPIAYGPVFANIAVDSGSVGFGIALAVLFSVVLTALDNTQDVLENPFDGLSPDDIQFYQPTALLHSRVSRTWSEAVPHITLPSGGKSVGVGGKENSASVGDSGAGSGAVSGGSGMSGGMSGVTGACSVMGMSGTINGEINSVNCVSGIIAHDTGVNGVGIEDGVMRRRFSADRNDGTVQDHM